MATTQGHVHGEGCGHMKMRHADHVDYLQDGRLHDVRAGGMQEHTIEVSDANPDGCHSVVCFHDHSHDPKVPHGDHVDFYHHGHLHHPHGDHCDDHGPVEQA
jgi:hypothetical protein